MTSRGMTQVQFNAFLTLALYGSERLDSGPGHFTAKETTLIPLGRRLCGPQNWSGHCGEDDNPVLICRLSVFLDGGILGDESMWSLLTKHNSSLLQWPFTISPVCSKNLNNFSFSVVLP
jgi:hypothetical protein